MDFFWGYIQDIMHSDRVESISNLHPRIIVAIAMVPVDVSSQLWGEVEFHFDICRTVIGAHIELH
jgi:hypothetical protein